MWGGPSCVLLRSFRFPYRHPSSRSRTGRAAEHLRRKPQSLPKRTLPQRNEYAVYGSSSDMDERSGESLTQRRFDELVLRGVLRYGPPLPIALADLPLAAGTVLRLACDVEGLSEGRLQHNQTCCMAKPLFYDEGRLTPTALLQCLRCEKPSFHLQHDVGGAPFSLLIRNCPYLQSSHGRVTFMRQLQLLHPVGSSPPPHHPARSGDAEDEDHGAEEASTPVLVYGLGKYKMWEAASFDGVRCGPQPWLYSSLM